MEIDLEKKLNLVDAFEMIVKLSEKYLDADSTNDLKSYFDRAIVTDVEDDILARQVILSIISFHAFQKELKDYQK